MSSHICKHGWLQDEIDREPCPQCQAAPGCPECGSHDLRVSIPVVFVFDGEDLGERVSSELEIPRDAEVACQECDWMGQVEHLEPLGEDEPKE